MIDKIWDNPDKYISYSLFLLSLFFLLLLICSSIQYDKVLEKNNKLEKQVEHQTMLIEILERTCE